MIEKYKPTMVDMDIMASIEQYVSSLPYGQRVDMAERANEWDFPDELRHLLPRKWEDMGQVEQEWWCGVLYEWIESDVGWKAILRHFHTNIRGKTDAQFEDWWDSMIAKKIDENYYQLYKSKTTENKVKDKGKFLTASLLFLAGVLFGLIISLFNFG